MFLIPHWHEKFGNLVRNDNITTVKFIFFLLSWDLYLQHILYGFSREISFDIERCRSRVDTRESWKLLHIFCIIYYLQTIGWDYVYGKDNLLYWHMWRHACDMAVEWYQKHYILRMRLSGKNPSNCWKFVWLCSNVKYIYLKKILPQRLHQPIST